MSKNSLNHYFKYLFFGIFLLCSVLAFLVVKPFVGSIVLSLFLCYVLYPIYIRLLYIVKNKTVAAVIMTALVSFVIIIPVALITQMIIVELLGIYSEFSLEAALSWFTSYFSTQMQELIVSVAKQAMSSLAGLLSAFVLSLPQKVLKGFVLLMTMFVAFRSGKDIFESLKSLLPIKASHEKKFIERFSQTTNAIVYGIVVVSFIQGIVAMIGFYIFGVSAPALWGFLTFLAALLPVVGPATVWVPLVLFKAFTGHVSAAIGLAVYSLVIQTILLDLILKPKLIGEKGRISPLIVLLGIVGGVMAFGIVGILLGPIVLMIFIEFLKVYLGKNAFNHKEV